MNKIQITNRITLRTMSANQKQLFTLFSYESILPFIMIQSLSWFRAKKMLAVKIAKFTTITEIDNGL